MKSKPIVYAVSNNENTTLTKLESNSILAALILLKNILITAAESKLMIHQPTIPGVPGNEGFKTKEAAQKVVDLVLSKINKGEMPPIVTFKGLKKLKTL